MTTPEGTAAAEAPPNAVRLAIHVFDDPVATFRTLARRPVFMLPIVLIACVTAVITFGTPTRVLEETVRAQVTRLEQQTGKSINEQMRSAMLTRVGSASARARSFAFGTAGALLLLVVVAAVLKLIFGAGAPDPITFRQEFAIASHAYLVTLLGAVITLGVIALTGNGTFSVSLGFLASSGFLAVYLSQLTVWGVWFVILLAIGNRELVRGESLIGPLVIIGGLWLAVKLLPALATRLTTG